MTAANQRAADDIRQLSRALGFMYCARNELDELEQSARGNLSAEAYDETRLAQSALNVWIGSLRNIRDVVAENHGIPAEEYQWAVVQVQASLEGAHTGDPLHSLGEGARPGA